MAALPSLAWIHSRIIGSPINTNQDAEVPRGFLGRFSIMKPLTHVTYAEFGHIVILTHRACQDSFGTPCDIAVTGYREAPLVTSLWSDDLNEQLAQHNDPLIVGDMPSLLNAFGRDSHDSSDTDQNAMARTKRLTRGQKTSLIPAPHNPSKALAQANIDQDEAPLMQKLWMQSGYVKVDIKPVDAESGPQFAYGCIEFKGASPKAASFYVQPYGGLDHEQYDRPNCSWQVACMIRRTFSSWRFSLGQQEHATNINATLAEAHFKYGAKFW